MDFTRAKKLLAGVSVAAMMLTNVSVAVAAYSDVPAGVWYGDAVQSLLEKGALDATQARFRPEDPANRAEFFKLVVELSAGLLGTEFSTPSFDDVSPSAWYFNYIEEAAQDGYVRGDGNCYGSHPCYARPAAKINRAEAAAVIVRAWGLDPTGDAPMFSDNSAGQWYTDVLQTAADHCVLQGDASTGRVRPGDYMNRAEMVVMLDRVDQGLSYGIDCGFDNPVEEAGIRSVSSIDGTTVEVEFTVAVDPLSAETAGNYAITAGSSSIGISSAVLVADNVVELTLDTPLSIDTTYTLAASDIMADDGTVFSDSGTFSFQATPTGNGTLEVVLSSSNPVGDDVPKGANGVSLLSLDLSASCDDDVVVTDMTVLHQGLGVETDIEGVYASVDGSRLTRKRTIDSQSQTADLHFKTALVVPRCQTKTVDILADFNSTATTAAKHMLAVELATDVDSNALATTGNFPLRGNTFSVAGVTNGKLTLSYRTVSPSTVKVGDKKVVVGKFEFSTDAVEDQTIYAITLHQNGSANDGDLTNIAIRKTDGTVLTNTVAATMGDYVTLTFNPPFTILQGDRITLEAVADVEGGAGDNAKVEIEESSDIFSVGSLYGYGVNGQLYGSQICVPGQCSGNTGSPTTVTIDAGQFTLEIDGPVQQKFKRDAKDAVLANVIATTGGEALNIRKMYMLVQAQSATGAGLTQQCDTSTDDVNEILEGVDIRNTVTGKTVSAVELGSGNYSTGTSSTSTYQIYRFDDFNVSGKQTWQVRGDFINNGTAAGKCPRNGQQFRVHICTQTKSTTVGCTFGGVITSTDTYNMDVQGLSTNDQVDDIRPGGTITGNFHRIATPSLAVAVKGLGTADSTVKNAKNVTLFRAEARAGEAEDILLTKMIFDSQSGSSASQLQNAQNYTLWVDTDGDRVVDTKLESGKSVQSSQVTFDQLAGGGYIIPKEQTVVFEVHADISASLNGDDLALKFATGTSVTYIEAQEAHNGSSLSGIKTGTTACSSASCDITVTIERSKNWLLTNQGNLYVTKDTSPLRARQLLGGTLGEPILRLRFRAENEDVDVTDIQFNSSGSTTASNDVDSLDLYFDGATTPFATATVGGCGSDDVLTSVNGAASTAFCANMESHQLVVAKGVDKIVNIRPRIKSDLAGASSAATVQLVVTGDNGANYNYNTGSGSIRARGMQSSNNLSGNASGTANGTVFVGVNSATTNATIVGSVNKTVLAKIDSITDANPATGTNPAIPSGVTPFGQFKFTALPNTNSLGGLNKWTLSGVIFNVNASNVVLNGNNFKMYNKADQSNKVACTTTTSAAASGAFLVYCKMLKTTNGSSGSPINTQIESGESATFVLEGDVTNPNIGSSGSATLQASLQNFSSMSNATFAAATSHIDWIDEDTNVDGRFKWVEYSDTVVNSTTYRS